MKYQLWALGYDADDCATDYEECLDEVAGTTFSLNALKHELHNMTKEKFLKMKKMEIPADTKIIHLVIEEVKQFPDNKEAAVDVHGEEVIEL